MCITGGYPTHLLHVYNYMCNTGGYPTHLLHVYNYMYNTILSLHLLHMLHMYYLYFYTCNTPKTLNMYYRCSTNSQVRSAILDVN